MLSKSRYQLATKPPGMKNSGLIRLRLGRLTSSISRSQNYRMASSQTGQPGVSTDPSIQKLVRLLDLSPHPEGGFYKRTYESAEKANRGDLPQRYHVDGAHGGTLPFSTAIYYLAPQGEYSALHKIASDEGWFYHAGAPMRVVELDEANGQIQQTIVGPNFDEGQRPQYFVKQGKWFGARPMNSGSPFSLVSCTVSPGFDFADFQLLSKDDENRLLSKHPQFKPFIDELRPQRCQ